MKYSIDELSNQKTLNRKNFIFFWGHQASKDGKITQSCFSQWWPCRFDFQGRSYFCSEQWMMAEKARLFNDDKTRRKIYELNDPELIKRAGREICNFNQKIWDLNKYQIVLYGNYLKFSQNEDLAEYLLATNEKVIVEANPYDRIWGIGLTCNQKNIENPKNWIGQNLLGFILMEIRDILRSNEELLPAPYTQCITS
ncbi:MAG: NADAR family protein [Spirochaetales bacterium]|nr:NADAR family protein [Spirochaetales bacterium]